MIYVRWPAKLITLLCPMTEVMIWLYIRYTFYSQFTMLIKDCVAFVLGTGAFYQCIFVKPIDIRPPLTKTKDRQSFINILTKK